jgi:hypothetical protein
MKVFASLALACVLAIASQTFAADSEWKSLFDGKSLDGWKINENDKSWSIEDGAIKSHGDRSHLFYVGDEKPFKNFHFSAQVMTKENSNAGIFIHTKFQKDGWPTQGYEAQVNNSYNKDPQKTGGLYNTVKVEKAPAEDNKWFKYEIIVEGQHIQVLIDGKQIVDYVEPKDKAGTIKLSPEGGTFALQAHDPGSTVFFKDIKVKRLAD